MKKCLRSGLVLVLMLLVVSSGGFANAAAGENDVQEVQINGWFITEILKSSGYGIIN